MADTILDAGDTALSEDKIPAFLELTFQWNEIEHQYIKEDIYNISSSVCAGEKKSKARQKGGRAGHCLRLV